MMIQPQLSLLTQEPWQTQIKEMVTDGHELLSLLNLTPQQVGQSDEAAQSFACRVPRQFIAKMRSGDPLDPLLLQVLPSVAELGVHSGYSHDPLQESASNPIPGLLHKYHGRVLLTAAPSCAVNCRYCFRRHFPYQDNNLGSLGRQKALDYIHADSTIHEVILSGGDPLMLPDEKLLALARAIVAIPHITTLRIHTRLPIVIPSRLTANLLNGLSDLPVNVVMVLHSNHPNELDSELAVLRGLPITVLNQAVLLRQINDSVDVLAELSHKLFSLCILPYYLHLLDKVAGAAHFAVSDTQAQVLYKELQTRLPGYLVPKLAREVPEALNKELIT